MWWNPTPCDHMCHKASILALLMLAEAHRGSSYSSGVSARFFKNRVTWRVLSDVGFGAAVSPIKDKDLIARICSQTHDNPAFICARMRAFPRFARTFRHRPLTVEPTAYSRSRSKAASSRLNAAACAATTASSRPRPKTKSTHHESNDGTGDKTMHVSGR